MFDAAHADRAILGSPEDAARDAVPLARLESEIAELAANLHAGMARFLDLLAEFDRREGWHGFHSCADWLSFRCGISAVAARDPVRVAPALEGLPRIRAAFRLGPPRSP